MLNVLDKTPQLRPPSAALILENGEILWGHGIGPKKFAIAELCFNTAQTGYQETLTDPSYAKQIITFTFPHIGIVGTNSKDLEYVFDLGFDAALVGSHLMGSVDPGIALANLLRYA